MSTLVLAVAVRLIPGGQGVCLATTAVAEVEVRQEVAAFFLHMPITHA